MANEHTAMAMHIWRLNVSAWDKYMASQRTRAEFYKSNDDDLGDLAQVKQHFIAAGQGQFTVGPTT